MQTIDFLDQLFVLTERIIIITHFTSSQYWLIPEKQSLQCNANIFSKGKQENTFPVCWVIIKISPLTGRGRAWEMSPTVNITLYQDIIHWPNLHYKLYQYPAPLRLGEATILTTTPILSGCSLEAVTVSPVFIFAMHILAWLCPRPNVPFVEN